MTNNLKICHLNVRSLTAHFQEVKSFVENYDIMAVSETWLNDGVDENSIRIPGFKFFRVDRPRCDGRGGGIGFYVSTKINCSKLNLNLNINNSIEQIWLNFTIKKTKVIIGCIYRPHGNLTNFLNEIDESLSQIIPQCDEIICLGDMNVDQLNLGNSLNKCFSRYGFEQLIKEPTRKGKTRSGQFKFSLLDVIFVSNKSLIESSGVEDNKNISDHFLISCEIAFNKPGHNTKFVTFRNFKNFHLENFIEDLVNAPFLDIIYIENIDDKIALFNTLLVSLFDKHAPICNARITKPKAPWLTYPIKMMMKERDKALSKYKNSRSLVDLNRYKELRNFTLTAIRREKKVYFNTLFENKNSKDLWNSLNNHVVNKPPIEIPSGLQDPDKINDYFSSVFVNEEADFELLEYYEQNYFKNGIAFNLRLVSVEEVHSLLHKIKSTSLGADNISVSMLKYCSPYLDNIITHIINCCIENSYFPKLWKEAVIKPLPKITVPLNYTDLRPISILPAISKILEKAIFIQLSSYISETNILSEFQAGFRKGYSTTTALMNVCDDIVSGIDHKEETVLVLLDFSKAFDTINHRLLCSKLKYYGCSPEFVSLVNSYLENRIQKVQVNGKISCAKAVMSGVPQGSILGPLLFLVYSTEILKSVQYCKVQAFADDIQVYYSFKMSNIVDAEIYINSDVNRISNLSKKHNLKLNGKKSNVIVFGNNQYIVKNNLNVKIGTESLVFKDSVRNLGILFDSDLKFVSHVNSLIQRSYVTLKLIFPHRHTLNQNTKKILTNSLILSRFSYGDSVYGPFLNKYDHIRIQKIQNACCRLVCGVRKYDHISQKIKELGWSNMQQRRKFNYCNILYKIIKSRLPPPLYHKLTFRVDMHSLNLRSNKNIHIPRHSSTMFKKCFSYVAVTLYNTILKDIIHLSPFSFKQKLKNDFNM